MLVIWVRREVNYFCEHDWTGRISLIAREIFRFWRTTFLPSWPGFVPAIHVFFV
jgi:hypothetical protein